MKLSIFKKPINIFVGLLFSTTISLGLSYIYKDLFYSVNDFTIGLPTLFGYPKRVDLFFAISVMVLFPILTYISGKIFEKQYLSFKSNNQFSIKLKINFKSAITDYLTQDKIKIIFKYHTVCALLGAIGLYGLIALLAKVFFIFLSSKYITIAFTGYFTFVILSLLFSLSLKRKISLDIIRKIYSYFIFLGQLSLLSFLSILLPMPYKIESGAFKYAIEINNNIYIYIAIFAVIALVDLLYRINNLHNKSTKLYEILSPISLSFVLLVFFSSAGLFTLPLDDYHFGEELLPLFLYQEYRSIPYVDYIMAHGFSNVYPSILAEIFTNNLTAESILYGSFLLKKTIIILSFCIIAYFFNIYIAIFSSISLLLLPLRAMTSLIVSLYLILFSKKLLQNPFIWLIIFIFISFGMVLSSAGTGSALVLSATPMAFYMLYKVLENKEYIKLKNILLGGITFLIFAVIFSLIPLLEISLSIINILLENSSINLEGFGIPWIWSFGGISKLFFAVFQNIWILIVPMFFILSICLFKKKNNRLDALTILSFALFSIFIMSYALGRIDPGALSRTGSISILFIFFFMPIVLYNSSNTSNKNNYIRISLLLISAVLFLIVTGAFRIPYIAPATTYLTKFNEDGQRKYIQGADYGLDNIGNIVIYKEHLDRLTRLNEVLNKYLKKEDAYLDLTNRNANYFYTDRKLIMESGAFYNMANTKQHLRSVEKIKLEKPKLILIEADNALFDGLTLSLRAYPIYRYITLAGYSTVKENNLIFMLKNNVVLNDISLLSGAIGISNLQKIPLSWGYSYKKLKSKMSLVSEIDSSKPVFMNSIDYKNNHYKITGNDPNIGFDISDKKINGQDAGLLLIDIECDKADRFQGEIYYTTDKDINFSENQTYKFWLKNGVNIIPVDLQPNWLLGGNINQLRFDIADKNSCDTFKINKFDLYQRNLQ